MLVVANTKLPQFYGINYSHCDILDETIMDAMVNDMLNLYTLAFIDKN